MAASGGDHMVIAVPLAVSAAGCFAVSNVLQARSVLRQGPAVGVDMRIISRLIRQRLWLAGLLVSIVGFAFQAVALGLAPVILVQPLVVGELLFALPLAAFTHGARLARREWSGAVLVTAGLVLFVTVVRPTNPRFDASPFDWVVLGSAIAVTVAVLVALASGLRGVPRTSCLAAAAGVSLGLMSVLTKSAAHAFVTHGISALATWHPWAVAASGIVGLSLAQNTFGAGPLAVSLPLIDIGEPLVASVIAVSVFGERLGHLSVPSAAALIVATAVVVAGVVMLDRSPLVQRAQAELTAESELGDRNRTLARQA